VSRRISWSMRDCLCLLSVWCLDVSAGYERLSVSTVCLVSRRISWSMRDCLCLLSVWCLDVSAGYERLSVSTVCLVSRRISWSMRGSSCSSNCSRICWSLTSMSLVMIRSPTGRTDVVVSCSVSLLLNEQMSDLSE